MKKLSKHSYWWWGTSADVIMYGIPISYIIARYDIFRFSDAKLGLTGWGMVTVLMVALFGKNKLQQTLTDYNAYMSETAQRGKWGLFFAISFVALMFAQIWIEGMLWFLAALSVGVFASLPLYNQHVKKKKSYTDIKQVLLKKKDAVTATQYKL